MSLGGVGFYSLTTTVAPGAGTKIGSHEITLQDGSKVYFQAIVVGYLSQSGIFCPVDPSSPLPVTPAEPGTGYAIHNSQAVAAGEQTVASATIPAGNRYEMNRLTASCHFEGIARLRVNGVERRAIRTGPAMPTASVEIDPQDATAGQTVTLSFEPRAGVPANALVSMSLDGRLVVV